MSTLTVPCLCCMIKVSADIFNFSHLFSQQRQPSLCLRIPMPRSAGRPRCSHHWAAVHLYCTLYTCTVHCTPCPGQQAQMQPPLSCWASLSAAQPSDLLTVQSQVQCCLALTLRHKHWLHASEIHSGCITLITLSWQSILAFSLPSPVWRWRAGQNWPSMNCYMISVWSNKS